MINNWGDKPTHFSLGWVNLLNRGWREVVRFSLYIKRKFSVGVDL